jgi:hypothetical protein
MKKTVSCDSEQKLGWMHPAPQATSTMMKITVVGATVIIMLVNNG